MQYDPLVKLIPTSANPKAMLKWHLGQQKGTLPKAVVVVAGGGGGGGGGEWKD